MSARDMDWADDATGYEQEPEAPCAKCGVFAYLTDVDVPNGDGGVDTVRLCGGARGCAEAELDRQADMKALRAVG